MPQQHLLSRGVEEADFVEMTQFIKRGLDRERNVQREKWLLMLLVHVAFGEGFHWFFGGFTKNGGH